MITGFISRIWTYVGSRSRGCYVIRIANYASAGDDMVDKISFACIQIMQVHDVQKSWSRWYVQYY